MIKFMRVLYCIVIVGISCVLVCINIRSNEGNITAERNMPYLLSMNDDYITYDIKNTNEMSCDLNALSFVYNSLVNEGYTLVEDFNTPEYMDVVLGKDNVKIRMRYEDKNLKVIASPYEYSNVPMLYLE